MNATLRRLVSLSMAVLVIGISLIFGMAIGQTPNSLASGREPERIAKLIFGIVMYAASVILLLVALRRDKDMLAEDLINRRLFVLYCGIGCGFGLLSAAAIP